MLKAFNIGVVLEYKAHLAGGLQKLLYGNNRTKYLKKYNSS